MAKIQSVAAQVQKIIDKLPELIATEAEQLPEIMQALVAENWNAGNNPNPNSKSTSDKLYKRSGDLTRALVKGRKGNIYKQTVGKAVFTAVYGIDKEAIPYRDVQEYGGTFTITEKQRGFFWAKFYETGAEMWKGLALAKQYTIPARPYFNPAKEALDKDFGVNLIKQSLQKELLLLWAKG